MLNNTYNHTKQLFESRYGLLFLFFLSLFFSISISFFNSQTTHAAFKAGNIISDAKFTDYNSMNASQIQQFLNSKNSVCLKNTNKKYQSLVDDNGDGVVADSTSEKYGRHAPMTAAQLINAAAKIYKINPQVILVTLQKEQGLITRTDCPTWRYNTALGYGCPDSAPCDNSAFGFTRQIDYGTYHFRGYFNDSLSYVPFSTGNHRIYYNPNQSCGSSIVNIQNRATASLYSYTPYQPNAGALAAGYGEAPCGAYGNRNFYLYFRDWFGSGQTTDLVRTTQNPTVYLISDNMKYSIPNSGMLNDLKRFGPVSYVSQSFINSKTMGPAMNRAIKGKSTSTVYFTNASIRLSFSDCALLVDYGLSCNDVITLTDSQLNRLSLGPSMSNLYQTTNNQNYYIKSGKKQEVFDSQSLQTEGVTGSYNRLLESGVSALPIDEPIIRDSVVVKSTNTGSSFLYTKDKFINIPNDLASSKAFINLPSGRLTGNSLHTKIIDNSFKGFAMDGNNNRYLLDAQGKTLLTSPNYWSQTYKLFGDDILAQSPNSNQQINKRFIKTSSNPSIYMVHNNKKHPLASMSDLALLQGNQSATSYSVIAKTTTDSIQTGGILFAPSRLIKVSGDKRVYIVNDFFQKSLLTSFGISDDLGFSSKVSTVPQSTLNEYMLADNASNFVLCESEKYIANRGVLYKIDATSSNRFGFNDIAYQEWDASTCNQFTVSSPLLSQYQFIKPAAQSKIYHISNGKKHPLDTMSTYNSMGGNTTNTLIVSRNFTSLIPED